VKLSGEATRWLWRHSNSFHRTLACGLRQLILRAM
jgi:hypothetical protein